MVVKFYYSELSPPSRGLQMVFEELGLEHQLINVDITLMEQKKPEFIAMNPLGQVPVISDDGFTLSESRAIAVYICNKYADSCKNTTLYPKDSRERAVVDMMVSRSEWVYKEIYAYLNPNNVLYNGHDMRRDLLPNVKKALAYLDSVLSESDFLAGQHLTIADCFAVCFVTFLDICGCDDYAEFASLNRWMERLRGLPYYEKCNRRGIDLSKAVFLELIAKHEKAGTSN